jgi:cell division protein ZapA
VAQVDVVINGHSYRIACDDGQEDHLKQLAEYIDRKLADLIDNVGQVGESRLLAMAGLVVADELLDAYAALEGGADGKGKETAASDAAMAATTENLADRIETIAARLQST